MSPRKARQLRAAVVADMLCAAETFKRGAAELHEFVEASPAWDPLTLRRKLNTILLTTLANVGDVDHLEVGT
jgi:hypothetical protein